MIESIFSVEYTQCGSSKQKNRKIDPRAYERIPTPACAGTVCCKETRNGKVRDVTNNRRVFILFPTIQFSVSNMI